MTLRRRTLLLIALTLGGLVAVLFGVVSHVWMGSFTQIEEDRTRTDVARLLEALAEDVRQLDRTALHWSAWDDTYAFVEDRNEAYLQSNLQSASVQALAVTSIAFVRAKDRITFGCSLDPEGRRGPLPASVEGWIEESGSPPGTSRPVNGFLRTAQGIVLVASRPILTSQRTGPPRGSLVLCRALDGPAVRRLAERTRLDAAVLSVSSPDLPADVGAHFQDLAAAGPHAVRPLDDDLIAGYAVVADVRGEPTIVLRVVGLREISAEGRWGLAVMLATLLVAGAVFGTLTVLLLERQVLSRLHRLGEEVRLVGTKGDLSLRTTAAGNDELEQIARSINATLDDLERAHRRRLESEAALRASEDTLRHTYKMEAIGQLAGGVAHDFNNLLTVVSGYTELLLLREGTDPSSREHLEAIRRAASRAADLTQQLLAFGRRQAVKPSVLHLDRFVAETADMLRRLVGEQVEVELTSSPTDPVHADPAQITQVLLNLASNARDAMPRGGRLTIDTAAVEFTSDQGVVRAGRWVRLSVSDDGVGMDAKTAQRIFEPFFTTKGVGRGSGLGLASVHGIVHQAGGSIAVETAPARGTTFRIYLPPCAVPAESGAGAAPRQGHAVGTETVLLVEDVPAVRDVARAALAARGYVVLDAATAHEALEIARESDFDILVTDVLMPRMKGPELAQRIRALRPEVGVLFVSGYPDDDEVREAIAAGAAFVAKPFTRDELAGAVRTVLDRGRPSLLHSK